MDWLDGWEYCKKITIPSDSIDGELSNFPLTVYLNDSNFDFSKCKADGSDIRFTDIELNNLKFERKEHDAVNKIAVYNVQLPTVSDTTDTEIYMWYGNENAYNASMEAWQDMTGKQLTYNGNVKLVPKQNAMRIATSTTGTDRLHYSKTGLINASKKTSMTAKIKIETAGVSQGCAFAIENGVKASYVSVKNGAVIFNSLSANAYTHTLDTLVAHEYRMELDGTSDCKYYVDDVLIFTASYADLYTLASNRFLWGDTAPNAGYGGSTVWSYVKYNLDTGGVSDNWVEWAPMSLPTSQGWDYYGTASLASLITEEYTGRMAVFDGSGDMFTTQNSTDFAFGTGDFCIETWVFPTNISGWTCLFTSRNTTTWANNVFFGFNNGTYTPVLNTGTNVVTSSVSLTPNTWSHVCLSRESGICNIFVNGAITGTGTVTNNFIDGRCSIGGGSLENLYWFFGSMQGFRITKGRARYTATFTPPTTFDIDGDDVVFCTNFDTVYDDNYSSVFNTGISLLDATGNGKTSSATGTTINGGIYGKYRSFNGTSDYLTTTEVIKAATSPILQTFTSCDIYTGASTMSFFGSSASTTGMFHFYCSLTNAGSFSFGVSYYGGSASETVSTVTVNLPSTNTPVVVTVVKTASYYFDVYFNGAKVISQAYRVANKDSNLNLGRNYVANYSKGNNYNIRVSLIDRSDEWIKAESLALKNNLLTITDFENSGGTLSLFFGMNF